MKWQKNGDPLQLPESYTVKLEPAVPIAGKVLDENGQPIADATVSLSISGLERRTWGVFSDRFDIFGETVTTDAAGEWRFADAPRKLDGLGIRISAEGFQPTTTGGTGDFRTSTGLTYASLRDGTADVVLSRGITLSGRVEDADGRAVPDARLTVGRDRWGSNLPTTTTDERGAFTFAGLGPEEAEWLSVEAAAFKPVARKIQIPAAEPLMIRLERGRVLRARVMTEDGTPCVGLRVGADRWREVRTLTFETRTDDDGWFVWNSAPEDAVTFNFIGREKGVFLAGLALTASASDQTVLMKPALRLSAEVVNQRTGKPVDNVRLTPGRVVGERRVDWATDSAKTYPNGRIEWASDRMGQDRVFRLEAEGYEPLQTRAFGTKQEEFSEGFEMVPLAAAAVPDPAEPAGSIALELVDAGTGEPIEGAEVEVRQSPDREKIGFTSDEDGVCRIPLVTDRPATVGVQVRKTGYVPKRIDWKTANPEFELPAEFKLALDRARAIGGIVVDEAGDGLGGVQLLVSIRGSSVDTSEQIHNDISGGEGDDGFRGAVVVRERAAFAGSIECPGRSFGIRRRVVESREADGGGVFQTGNPVGARPGERHYGARQGRGGRAGWWSCCAHERTRGELDDASVVSDGCRGAVPNRWRS